MIHFILKSICQFNFRFPFVWKNPFGFLAVSTMEYVMFLQGMKIGACILVLGIGSFLYAIALSKIIKKILFAINRNTQCDKIDSSIFVEQIVEFMELHLSAQQLSA